MSFLQQLILTLREATLLGTWETQPMRERFLGWGCWWARAARCHHKARPQPVTWKPQPLPTEQTQWATCPVSDKDLVAFWSCFISLSCYAKGNATDTNVCDESVFNPLCQKETIPIQLNARPMLNKLKWEQARIASFQPHAPTVRLSLSSTAGLSPYSLLAFWSISLLTWTSLINQIFRYS